MVEIKKKILDCKKTIENISTEAKWKRWIDYKL